MLNELIISNRLNKPIFRLHMIMNINYLYKGISRFPFSYNL